MKKDNPDSAAGREILTRYYAKVYKLCLFHLRRERDAEDAAQQACLKILQNLDRFRGEADPFTWMYRIAVNTALSHLRKRRLLSWLRPAELGEEEELPPLFPRAAADPAELLEEEQEQNRRHRLLQDALETLSDRERTALYLCHYEGRKQKEVAAIMNTSLGAVEALLHKAMKKLRRAADLL